MPPFIEALIGIAAVAAFYSVYRLEKKHDALVAHVFELENQLKHLLRNEDDFDDD